MLQGENIIKGAKGANGESFPMIAHDTCHFCIGL
jgi:hypothetical protein